MAKELKRRGWRFVGPTTVYAFMQAMGLVNDHLEGCDAREPALPGREDGLVGGADYLLSSSSAARMRKLVVFVESAIE